MEGRMSHILDESYEVMKELLDTIKVEEGQLVVVGCSTSEVLSKQIGSSSSEEVGKAIYDGMARAAKEAGVFLAAQCCEHLNRSLIVEREIAIKRNYTIVTVVPQPKAGGSFATAAFRNMTNPVAVEAIEAEAGIDIGNTMIGMHLRKVAVPIRLSKHTIGEANLVFAYTRPKYVGGPRAVYI